MFLFSLSLYKVETLYHIKKKKKKKKKKKNHTSIKSQWSNQRLAFKATINGLFVVIASALLMQTIKTSDVNLSEK